MQGGLGLNGIPKGAEGEENLTLYLKLLGTTIGADAWRTLGSIFEKQTKKAWHNTFLCPPVVGVERTKRTQWRARSSARSALSLPGEKHDAQIFGAHGPSDCRWG